jgi:hypothetical protein
LLFRSPRWMTTTTEAVEVATMAGMKTLINDGQ